MDDKYDVIVVGARCAGSPTAMLLARNGYRVLVVDRATFPSDTLSTHIVHPPAVAALQRWGILDKLVATGCPPIDTYVFDFETVTISGAPGDVTAPVAYCPRRTVLDPLLVDAARRGRRGGTRGVHRRRARLPRRPRRRHQRARARRPDRDRARRSSGGGGRSLLARRPHRGSCAVSREATVALRLLLVLEQPPDARTLRAIHPAQLEDSPPRRPTTDSRSSSQAGTSRTARPTSTTSRGTTSRRSRRHPSSPSECAAPPARLDSPARRCPATSADRSDPGGRSWATPDTTRTSSLRRASSTRSATRYVRPRTARRALGDAPIRRRDARLPDETR